MPHYVYILRCSDNSYYVGASEDVAKRVTVHNNGSGTVYTKNRRPVVLVYQEECENRIAAVRRERKIKKWTRAKKEALFRGDIGELKTLSKKRG